MLRARIVGTATSTVKHPSMNGRKLLVVQPMMADDTTSDGDPVIAVDSLGAGKGDSVVLSSDGRATRELLRSDTTPVQWCVVGIEDEEFSE